jgi:hypothetical protein
LNVTTISLALAICGVALIGAATMFELMIWSDSNQGFTPMSKNTTTNENDVEPDAAAASPAKWVLPDNFRDVTAERIGERFALVGPPQRAAKPDAD